MTIKRFGLLGLFSGVIAALVVMLLGARSAPSESKDASSTDFVQVVIVTTFVPQGTTLKAAQLATKAWPANLVPDGAATSLETAIGRTTLVPLFRNEPVLETRLNGASAGPTALVQDGRTVFALPSDAAHAVGGMITSGDRIAVIGAGANRSDVPALVMQDVTVLGVAGEAPLGTDADTASNSGGQTHSIVASTAGTRTAQRILLLDVSLDQAAQLAALIDVNRYYVALTQRSVVIARSDRS